MPEPNKYIRTVKAWYYPVQRKRDWIEEIFFYSHDPYGEMAMRWYDLGGPPSPRLEVFIESAYALASLTDVLAALAHISAAKEDMTPDGFCQLLEECGFVDKTPYVYEDSYPNESRKKKL